MRTRCDLIFAVGNLRALTTVDMQQEEEVDYEIILPPDFYLPSSNLARV